MTERECCRQQKETLADDSCLCLPLPLPLPLPPHEDEGEDEDERTTRLQSGATYLTLCAYSTWMTRTYTPHVRARQGKISTMGKDEMHKIHASTRSSTSSFYFPFPSYNQKDCGLRWLHAAVPTSRLVQIGYMYLGYMYLRSSC